MAINFYERQRFNQSFFWFFLIAISLLFLFAFSKQILFHHPFGNKPMSDRALISSVIFLGLVNFLFFSFKLKTTITDEAIIIKLNPFHIFEKKFEWSQLSEIKVRKYNPIKEYSGWGLRGFARKKTISIQGHNCIELIFHNGQSLLIGTQKPNEAFDALSKANLGKLNISRELGS